MAFRSWDRNSLARPSTQIDQFAALAAKRAITDFLRIRVSCLQVGHFIRVIQRLKNFADQVVFQAFRDLDIVKLAGSGSAGRPHR